MITELIILGSTGSIGETTLNIVKKNKKRFKVKLISTNRNIKKIYKQALEFNVKKVVINDMSEYSNYSNQFKKKRIRVFNTFEEALKGNKKKN